MLSQCQAWTENMKRTARCIQVLNTQHHKPITTLHDSPAYLPVYEYIKEDKAWRMYLLLTCTCAMNQVAMLDSGHTA